MTDEDSASSAGSRQGAPERGLTDGAVLELEPPAQPPLADPAAATPVEPLAPPVPTPLEPLAPPAPPPAVESTRRLLGASFELLTATSDDMRGASFYIGVLVLVTVAPFALASWAVQVVSIHHTAREMDSLLRSGVAALLGSLGAWAVIGIGAAAVESRAMAAAILGGRRAGRPVTVRAAVERSRMVFWHVIFASFIVGVPVLIAQFALSELSKGVLGEETDVGIVSSTLAAALAGAPLAYLLSGIVLGDVLPFEATRRSIRVFRARKVAAALVAVFETTATFLIVLGLSAGLDLVVRVFTALGLGPDSGPAGQVLMTIAIVAGVFALGTLVYTAYAIAIAPQIVMFIGLTHATFGLDHVRPGGDRDPAVTRPGKRRFRWLTRPMLLLSVLGGVGLVATIVLLNG